MNFVPLLVETVDGAIRVVSAQHQMDVILSDAEADAIRRAGVNNVILGVRPEHIENRPRRDLGLEIRASVEVIEFLGNEVHVHVTSGDDELVVIVDARTPLSIGDVLTLSASSDGLHFFHPETGVVLR